MELTGKVILNNESKERLIEDLRKEIRKEVIEELTTQGIFNEECIQYMKTVDIKRYYEMLRLTINHIIVHYADAFKDESSGVAIFDDDHNRYRKLIAIKNIIDIK